MLISKKVEKLESKIVKVPIGYSANTLVDVFAYTFHLKHKDHDRLHQLICHFKSIGFVFGDLEDDVKNWDRMVWVFGYIRLEGRLKVEKIIF
jgi:hypothetical protein